MSADERKDMPPLAAGGSGGASDPEHDAFGSRKPTAKPPGLSKETPTITGQKTETKPEAKPDHHQQFVGTGVFWGLVIGVILAIIVIVFASQNTQAAVVKVITWEWSSPLFVVVLISLIVGIVLDEIVGLLFRSRRRRRLAEKAELHRLRDKR